MSSPSEWVELVKQNPGLFTIIGGIIVGLILILIFQGRPIKTRWFEFGGTKDRHKETPTPSISVDQSPSITQSPSINVYSGNGLSSNQMDELADRVAEKVLSIRQELNNKPPSYLYQPTKLSKKLIYIFSVKFDIENKMRDMVINWGGGWTGVSLASFDTFYEYARKDKLIPEQLAFDINDFFMYTRTLTSNFEIGDEAFLEIQYLAAKINRELDFHSKQIEEDPASNIYQQRKALEEYDPGAE